MEAQYASLIFGMARWPRAFIALARNETFEDPIPQSFLTSHLDIPNSTYLNLVLGPTEITSSRSRSRWSHNLVFQTIPPPKSDLEVFSLRHLVPKLSLDSVLNANTIAMCRLKVP